MLTAVETAKTLLRRHRLEDGDLVVTEATYPALFDAFETISHDNGWGAGHESYVVPAHWIGYVEDAEKQLSSMDPEWRQWNFVLGEAGELETLLRQRPELNPTHELLNDFFDDWEPEA